VLIFSVTRRQLDGIVRDKTGAAFTEISGFSEAGMANLITTEIFVGIVRMAVYGAETGVALERSGILWLAHRLEQRAVRAGEIVVKEGEKGDKFFLISSGRFGVFKSSASKGMARSLPPAHESAIRRFEDELGGHIAFLQRLDYFGEMALINPAGTRQASVAALEDSRILVLKKEDFDELLRRFPTMQFLFNYIEQVRRRELEERGSDAPEAAAAEMHDENIKHTPGIPRGTVLCHIIADSILPIEQRNTLKTLEQEMRGKEYCEKVLCLSGADPDRPEEFIAALERTKREAERICREQGAERVEFTAACPKTEFVARVQKELGIKTLAFRPCEESGVNIAQLEGIILALRALHSGRIENLAAAFKIINDRDLPLDLAKITDIDELARRILFILPTAKVIDYRHAIELNALIQKNIKTAA
jgi:CRP-like cAMP-binding protein